MLSIVNYVDYDLSPKYAIIQELTKGPRTTSELMKLRCNGKRMACVSTYVSSARRFLASTGSTILCKKVGEIGNEVFTYTLV